MILLSVLIWCGVVVATADYVRRSLRVTETIDRDHPDLWEKVHFRRWAADPSLMQQASQLAALLFVGFPRDLGTQYPQLREPINKCRDFAYGVVLLFVVAIVSMSFWPKT